MKPASQYLIKAMFAVWNHYQAVLPYNLNWQIKLGAREREILSASPLIICDVGARGSAPEELAPFYPYMIYAAFDADEAECERLNSLRHLFRERHIYPYFIGRDSRDTVFYLYERLGESSPYLPHRRFRDVFEGNSFSVQKQIQVSSSSLDDVYQKEDIELPDLVKLDTQGSELEILHGAASVIRNASIIEIEVEFMQMYDGQPLFHDVMKFMHDNGFELLYLNRVFGQRNQVFRGQSRGQLIFGDALFGRREDQLNGFTKERIVKYILLLINYGHLDFACHLLVLHPDVALAYPVLGELVARNSRQSRLKRFLVSQLDKGILFLLHARKCNQLSFDSDRSWPTR